ncbi:hypothetical protein AB3X94_37145 [Paraburkholderia sp. BR10923]|uniref:hypothetical protein n=1 Tax=Paraburkholderia sp. BR10923 TaxID=3236992 RepID=UPI0034CE75EE
MGEKIFHHSIPVRHAMLVDDETLCYFLSPDGDIEPAAEIRADLVIRNARGHKWIAIGHCTNFDPATGCLGHAREELEARALVRP